MTSIISTICHIWWNIPGSDLDGDEYFVCWSENLHPRIRNKDPGDYEAAKTQLESEAITAEQLTNQVVKHITKPNNLGGWLIDGYFHVKEMQVYPSGEESLYDINC